MPLPRPPLLLLGVVLASFGRGRFCGSPSDSLCYSYLYLPEPSQGLPHFSIRGYLDDQPIAHYDSFVRKMEPLVPWMEEVKEEDTTFQALEWMIGIDLEKLSELDHQTGGPHTWQAVLSCELWEDGSKGGFLHYGYNGSDFISFDKETLRWVAAQPQAEKVKEEWEIHPGRSQRKKTYLEETCIEWLQRYRLCKKEVPQRIEPPVGKVTRKEVDDHLEVLICQAFGFYPKQIQATWTRDGEICEYETLPRNVAPNSDGTYYIWLSIDIDPKERARFRCRLEHQGLQEPLILTLEEEIGGCGCCGHGRLDGCGQARIWWSVMGILAAAILLFLICRRWRCRKKHHQEETTSCDQVPPEMVRSPLSTEDEIQIE